MLALAAARWVWRWRMRDCAASSRWCRRTRFPTKRRFRSMGRCCCSRWAISVAVALLFGLAPALQLAGRDLLTPLKEAGRGVAGGAAAAAVAERAGGRRGGALRGAAGGREPDDPHADFDSGSDLAFHPDRILTLRIPFSEQRYPDADRRECVPAGRAASAMQSAPGVLAVGINTGLPPVYNWSFPVVAVGSSQQDNRRGADAADRTRTIRASWGSDAGAGTLPERGRRLPRGT